MDAAADPKSVLYEAFADVAKALAQAHRLEILEALAQREMSVETVAGRCRMPMASASQHLQTLLRAGLVSVRRDGNHRLYRLAGDAVVQLVSALRAVAEAHHAQSRQIIRDYFEARDRLEPVSRDELAGRIAEGSVTVLDVRSPEEYAAAHIPGARNAPLAQLGLGLDGLDPDKEIVAYCRGPFCILSFDAVEMLRRRGLRVRRFGEGLPEWRAAGLPVVGGKPTDPHDNGETTS